MRGYLLKMLVISGLMFAALSGCNSLVRPPDPTDQPPATFEAFKDIRPYPDQYDTLELHDLAIPAEYVPAAAEEFNQAAMIREYDMGHKMGVGGVPWRRLPPGYRV